MKSEEQFIKRCKEILAKDYCAAEENIVLLSFSCIGKLWQAIFIVDDEYCIQAAYERDSGKDITYETLL